MLNSTWIGLSLTERAGEHHEKANFNASRDTDAPVYGNGALRPFRYGVKFTPARQRRQLHIIATHMRVQA